MEAKIKNPIKEAHSSLSNTIGSLAGAGKQMLQTNKKKEHLTSINVEEEPVYGIEKATGHTISGGMAIGNTDRSYRESTFNLE